MGWTIEYAASIRRSARKLSPEVRERIRVFLEERLAPLEDPRQLGVPLRGTQFEDLWRYRVGDYRIIVRIEDVCRAVLVLIIAHRRDVYRRR